MGDKALLELEDAARRAPLIFPEVVCDGGLLGVPTFAREPLLMNVDPGRSPNLGKAK